MPTAEQRAVIDIESLTVNEGFLPVAKRRRVLAWVASRKAILSRTFDRTRAHETVESIA